MSETFEISKNWKWPFPKCPYNTSFIQWATRIGLIIMGTWGLLYFNIYVSIIYLFYSLVFNFVIMPVKHCKYCYYNITSTDIDKQTGKTSSTLLDVETWKKNLLHKHVICAKKWGSPNFFVLWLSPIILVGFVIVTDFSLEILIILLSFLFLLAIMGLHMRQKVCPGCVFMKECHSSF